MAEVGISDAAVGDAGEPRGGACRRRGARLSVDAQATSHVGIGTMRGAVVRSDDELARVRAVLHQCRERLRSRHVPELPWPILQRYFALGSVDVISLCGCFDEDGKLVALPAPAR